MTFQSFNQLIKDQFQLMSQQPVLFRSKVSGDALWDLYIQSFTKEDDPIFRDPNSTSHTCNNDKNFIRRYGNIVAIINGGCNSSVRWSAYSWWPAQLNKSL